MTRDLATSSWPVPVAEEGFRRRDRMSLLSRGAKTMSSMSTSLPALSPRGVETVEIHGYINSIDSMVR